MHHIKNEYEVTTFSDIGTWDSISSKLLAPHADAANLLASFLHHQSVVPPVGHKEPDTIILHNSDNLNREDEVLVI